MRSTPESSSNGMSEEYSDDEDDEVETNPYQVWSATMAQGDRQA